MNEPLRILILEDVPADAELMQFELAEAGIAFTEKCVSDEASFRGALDEFSPNVILSDFSLPSFDGLSALKIARERCPDVPYIFVSGALGEELAIELLKQGATDYILKDRMSRLAPAVSRALQEVGERNERKNAQNALQQSEIRYKTIFENTGTATIIIEKDATIVLANKQFEKLSGFSRAELEGRKIWTGFVFEDDLCRVEGSGKERGGASLMLPEGYEFRIVNRQGDILHVMASVASIPSTNRTVLSLLDVTTLKKAEQEKRAASLYARSLIEASLDPLVTISAGGKIMDVNRAMEAVTGLPREALIDSDFADYFTDRDKAGAGYREVFSKGLIRDYPLAIRTLSGRVTDVLLNASLYRDEAGEIQGVVASARDITERLEAEKKILANNELLRSLSSELVMTEERERRRIAVDLHDSLGQALALTKIKLDSIMEQAAICDLAGPMTDIKEMVDQSIQQTRSLTRELSPSVLYELGLSEAIDWLGEQMQSQHGLKVILHDRLRSRKIDADIQILLFRATRELLLNVVKHARAKDVHITLQKLGENIEVTVKDDGIGFDSSRMEQTSKRQTGGFGLLSVRERLHYMGGAFEIETQKKRGTSIRMVVPQKRKKSRN